MYILLDVSYANNKESQALRTDYNSETELLGDFESKLGLQMRDANCKAVFMVAMDHTGKIYNQGASFKEDVTISPRLVWVTSDSEGEHPNLQKYEAMNDVMANYHVKRGDSMKGTDLAIMTMAIDGTNISQSEYWVRQPEE